MAPVKKMKCDRKENIIKVREKGVNGRSKEHDFKINQIKQVQKKVGDASNALIRVEYKEDHIKIKPNRGNFKVISEEVKKMKCGDEIRFEIGPIAKVTDQYYPVGECLLVQEVLRHIRLGLMVLRLKSLLLELLQL